MFVSQRFSLMAVAALASCLLMASVGRASAVDDSNGGLVNSSACICAHKECCVAIGKTSKKALSIRLTHIVGEPEPTKAFKVVLNKCPGGGAPGPSFADGSYSKPIVCDGVWHDFDLNGGATAGEFQVYIEYGSACVPCGKICVLGGPADHASPFGLSNPPGAVDLDGNPTDTPAGQELAGVNGLTHQLPANHCGDKGTAGHVDFGPIYPHYEYWIGPQDKQPYLEMKPTPAANPGNGKFGSISDDCHTTITMYCVAETLFKGFITDCHGDSRHIASCLFETAQNDIKIFYETCGEHKGFVKIMWINENKGKPDDVKKNGRRNIFVFDPQTNTGSGTHVDEDGSKSPVPNFPGLPGGPIDPSPAP